MLCWRLLCSCVSCLLVYSFDCLHGRLLAMRTFLWHPRSCGRFKSPPFRPRIHIAIKIQVNAHVAHQRLRKSLLDHVALNFIFSSFSYFASSNRAMSWVKSAYHCTFLLQLSAKGCESVMRKYERGNGASKLQLDLKPKHKRWGISFDHFSHARGLINFRLLAELVVKNLCQIHGGGSAKLQNCQLDSCV